MIMVQWILLLVNCYALTSLFLSLRELYVESGQGYTDRIVDPESAYGSFGKAQIPDEELVEGEENYLYTIRFMEDSEVADKMLIERARQSLDRLYYQSDDKK